MKINKPIQSISPQNRASRDALIEKHDEILLILAPPRTASTSLARLFWEHERVGFYCHEPFEVVFHDEFEPLSAWQAMQSPIDLSQAFGTERGNQLLIKEMTFQVVDFFEDLAALATRPIIFLIRDPRLSLMSRIKRLSAGGESILFPHRETGWQDLQSQVQCCEQREYPHIIVDSTAFRNDPKTVLPRVLASVGLPYGEHLLSWRNLKDIPLGGRWEARSHWYSRVMSSPGILPATETIPEMDRFPDYWQDHLQDYMAIYRQLLAKPQAIHGS